MKKIYSCALSVIAACMLFVSCGPMAGNTTGTTTNSQGSVLGALLGGMTGGASSSTINTGSIIGSIIGQLMSSTNTATIVGTWTYAEPTVQFESENWLAQAGGVMAAQTVVNKIAPYYEKVGIKSGTMKVTFAEDGSCKFNINGREYPCTYTYDVNSHKLTLIGGLGYNMSAYVTVSANELALTFDVTKLMSLAQTVAQKSSNSTISSLSSLANQYTGMKTGFLFKRN